jgi:xanthine dehydrogenase accessory factor
MTRELLAELLAALRARRAVVVATRLPSGEARLLDPFAEGEGEDPALRGAAREAALLDRAARLDTAQGPVFLRPYPPPVRLAVVGAVHVAQALAPMARLAGYEVLVIDPRRAFATEARFPGVALAHDWPDEALARLPLDRRSAVVTLTHDPKIDDPALAAALRSDAFYVGALGSQRTQAARRERLRELGFADGDLARIHGPVGLAIGAASPGEIAAAILAELVSCLRRPAQAAP